MLRYAAIKKNDIANAPGVCVSVYLQGCPHHCPDCFNPETWDFNGGKPFTEDTMNEIINSINANGIMRNLCILGGEPLCLDNDVLTYHIIKKAKETYPDIKIYIWTGYLYEELINSVSRFPRDILSIADYLIDGPFIKEQKDLILKMRGSKNQRIINLTKTRKNGIICIEKD